MPIYLRWKGSKLNVKIFGRRCQSLEASIQKYLHWPLKYFQSNPSAYKNANIHTHTHTHTLKYLHQVDRSVFCVFLTFLWVCWLFFSQLCSVWLDNKKPADPRWALHKKKEKKRINTWARFPLSVYTLAEPEDSNFYVVKLKHKSSFVSFVFLHEVDAVRRRRVYNSPNIRNETTAQWSLYVKYLEQMFSCRLCFCFCFCLFFFPVM